MAGVQIRFLPYGSPGDVETVQLSKPETLAKWQEEAKVAKAEKANYLEVTGKPPYVNSSSQVFLVNVDQVVHVLQI